MGIRPQALINYITLSGGGFDRKQGAKLQIHTMLELTKMVSHIFISTHEHSLSAFVAV